MEKRVLWFKAISERTVVKTLASEWGFLFYTAGHLSVPKAPPKTGGPLGKLLFPPVCETDLWDKLALAQNQTKVGAQTQ